jgi:Tfp pilus assembly protein PilN
MHLDFVHPRRPSSVWGWSLLLAGLLVCGALLWWRYSSIEEQIQLVQDQLQVVQRQQKISAGPTTPRLTDKQLLADWKHAARVTQELSAPWQGLLAVLEGAAEQPVALLSLEFDGSRHDMVLTGEARNYSALLDYYRYLQQQKVLGSVALQTHQMNMQDKDKPMRFRISALWEPAQ